MFLSSKDVADTYCGLPFAELVLRGLDLVRLVGDEKIFMKPSMLLYCLVWCVESEHLRLRMVGLSYFVFHSHLCSYLSREALWRLEYHSHSLTVQILNLWMYACVGKLDTPEQAEIDFLTTTTVLIGQS
jgi:hypothetical protein